MTEGGALSNSRLPKPWGRRDLPDPFGTQETEIGEVWFDRPQPLRDILAKYLFTGEKLSVQVHPTPQNSPTGVGKDECWLVTQARPDAILAIGFRDNCTEAEIRRAALDGSIGHMLEWRAVRENDFFYVPSGTVHAIGPGLTLVEIQQNTDITHRLFDYGRDRKLHLDEALKSIIGGPHDDALRRRVDPQVSCTLVDGPYFRLAHCAGQPDAELRRAFGGAVEVLPLAGRCTIANQAIGPGEAGWATHLDFIDFSQCSRSLLVSNP